MKLIRFGERGREKPGLEQDSGQRVDLSDSTDDYTPEFFASGGVEKVKALVAGNTKFPSVAAGVRLGPPVARPHKFIAIGLNYRKHAEEMGSPIPTEPVVFTKLTSCIMGPNDDVFRPAVAPRLPRRWRPPLVEPQPQFCRASPSTGERKAW